MLYDEELIADTGRTLASLSTKQVPRWSLTCLIYTALVLAPQATYRTKCSTRCKSRKQMHLLFPTRT